MSNPLQKNNLFATPANLQELQDSIEGLPKKDKALVYQYVMMTWNLASDMAGKEIARLDDMVKRV